MNPQQATALIMYMNRCIPIIPTTAMEWSTIQPILSMFEAVAGGAATVEVKSTIHPEPAEPAAE